jgi:hypothetical protein
MADFPDLVGALESALRDANAVEDWDPLRLHISDTGYSAQGGQCKRQLYLRLQGAASRPPSTGMMWLWDRGQGAEARVLELLRERLSDEWEIHTQVEVEYDGIKGTLDFLLIHKETGFVVIIDCKTARGNAFSRLEQEPKESHVLQVSTYAVDREGQNGFIQWEVVPDKAAVDQAIGEVREVSALGYEPAILRPNLNLRENKGPDSVTIKEPWQCSYCDFRGVSCDGAIPPHMRDEIPDKGLLVGHQQADGTFKPRAGVSSGLVNLTKSLL